MTPRLATFALPLALWACDESADPTPSPPTGEDRIAFETWKADAPASPTQVRPTRLGGADTDGALLELVLTDVWGRLPDRPSALTLTHEASGARVVLEGYLTPVLLNLSAPGNYTLTATMPDHAGETLRFEVDSARAIGTPSEQVTHWGFSVDPRTVGGETRAVHSLYLGLEHLDFAASGPPPRRGNAVEVFDNGRDAFATLAADLYAVTMSFHAAFWLARMDFELVRHPIDAGVSEEDRARESIGARIAQLGARTRLLLSQFNGAEDTLNELFVLDDQTEAFAEDTRDDVEVLVQPNETEVPYRGNVPVNAGGWSYRERLIGVYPEWSQRTFTNDETFEPGRYDRDVSWTDLQVASWHQKFAVLDERVAFLGGAGAAGVRAAPHAAGCRGRRAGRDRARRGPAGDRPAQRLYGARRGACRARRRAPLSASLGPRSAGRRAIRRAHNALRDDARGRRRRPARRGYSGPAQRHDADAFLGALDSRGLSARDRPCGRLHPD
jgi:hypothetical protein